MSKKFTIAVVGPSDSVELITEVANERQGELDIFPIVYQTASEVPEIIEKNNFTVDLWLFSGKVPYYYAIKSNATQKPIHYIPHVGSSLYRVLLQMAYEQKMPIDKISFDSFYHKEIEETFSDISTEVPHFYLFDYDDIVSPEIVTQYHYDLWKNKQTNFAVTSFLSSYLKLKELGVPTFRIYPTRDTIRTVLTIATSDATAMHFKGGQIAIHHITINGYAEFLRSAASTYAAKRVELKLYDLLMNYTESVKGSIIMHENGNYTIYSTRGAIESLTNHFTVMPLLDKITHHLSIQVNGGIGFGSTAYAADENANIALSLARQAGKNEWMIVLDNKTACGPLNSESHIQYELQTNNASIRTLSEELKISITTVNRLLASCENLDQQNVTANDIAAYLNITPRTARRLLISMEEHNYAILIGQEGSGQGRPHKLYQICLEQLLAGQKNI